MALTPTVMACMGAFICMSLLSAWSINLSQGTKFQLMMISKQLERQQAAITTLHGQISDVTLSRRTTSTAQTSGAPYFEGMYMGNGKVFCLVKPLGVPLFLEGADVGITPHLCRGLGWEPDTSAVFRRLIKPGYHVLDVGTNIGYFTVMYTQIVGSTGRVLGIEASPRTFDLVSTSVELNGLSGTTQVINKAVYDADGQTVQISTSRDRVLNNRVMPNQSSGDAGAAAGTAAVSTITIDTAVSGWNKLDFIKIDVEGAEQLAYQGMRNTLAKFPNIIIIMEVNTARMGLDKARAFYEQLQRDFPTLRRLAGARIVPTSVDELFANRQADDMVVLTKRVDIPLI